VVCLVKPATIKPLHAAKVDRVDAGTMASNHAWKVVVGPDSIRSSAETQAIRRAKYGIREGTTKYSHV